MSQSTFSVPASLEVHVDEGISEAHEALASMSLDDVVKRMTREWHPDTRAGSAGYVDMAPYSDHDRTSAVVIPFPYGNGWAPHMAIRAFMAQDSLDESTRFILFPNDKTSYDLTKQELAEISNGNFEPLAHAQLAALAKLKIDKIHYVGYSQGATVGAAALKLAARQDMFELGSSGLFEPANVEGCTPSDLQKRFIKSGKGLNKAVNDSAIPALSEVQHTRGGIDTIAKYVNFIPVVVNSQSAKSKAIHNGFTFPYFLRDVKAAFDRDIDGNLAVLVASGEESLITPKDVMQDIEEIAWENPRMDSRVVEGEGHAMGDNVVLHAILTKLALKTA